MLLMIQCQKSIRFAPQNLHAIFAKRNWKKILYFMHTLLKSNPKIRRDSAINGKWNQAQNMRWNWAICTELHFQFRSQNLDDVASDFFSWFLKFNYLWFMGIFSIFYSQFNQIFPSNLLFTKNPTSWNFWLQFQMGFVYICQEWLSKIGTAHMCSAAWISS